MLTVAISLKRAMALAALVLSTSAPLAVHAAVAESPAAAPPGERCVQEEYVWAGPARLGGGVLAVQTGLSIAAAVGERLEVVATSSDGVDAMGYARPLPVTVGGVTAAVGATVPGGPIVVSADGDEVLDVSGVTVVVDRCTEVQALSGGTPLPRTGSSVGQAGSALGVLAVCVGSAMVVAGRRRSPGSTAGGRGPGWPPAARPPSRG